MESNIGYRDDGLFGGDGPRDIIEVLSYETGELNNTGSLQWCMDHYELSNELVADLSNLVDTGLLSVEEMKPYISRMLNEINKSLGKNLKYCVWLTDEPEDIYFTYIAPYPDETVGLEEFLESGSISKYKKSPYLLDNADSDGKLYAYEEYPTPLE